MTYRPVGIETKPSDSQVVYCVTGWGIPMETSTHGGSIAIGHPYGVTGSRLTAHAADRRQASRCEVCVVTCGIWCGQGAGRSVRKVL